jgi:prepilin-type N-terminal cleavage/methylation domain-containing protein
MFKKLRDRKGFTLIELVMIIVILGILAATAVIRYVDLAGDAQEAACKGIYGHIVSAYGVTLASVKGAPGITEVRGNLSGNTGDLCIDANGDGVCNPKTAPAPDSYLINAAIATGTHTILGTSRRCVFTISGDPITTISDVVVTTY